MRSFPNTFSDGLLTVVPDILDRRGSNAIEKLHSRGYFLVAGLTESCAEELPVIGSDPEIVEYCPKDCTENRFGTLDSTAAWLKKHGGRAAYLLINSTKMSANGDLAIAGYGWSGAEPNEEEYTGQPITTAYRLAKDARGRGLGKPFIQSIVSATRALNTDEGIGLETWGSNSAAVGSYLKLGFELRATRPDVRPTLRPDTTEDAVIVDGWVSDTRLYMAYPDELFVK